MATSRAATRSARPKGVGRHHEEPGIGVQVALLAPVEGFLMSTKDV
ncbi:MAG: hypothetical protein WBM46_20635 [Polyangiales bacterium]